MEMKLAMPKGIGHVVRDDATGLTGFLSPNFLRMGHTPVFIMQSQDPLVAIKKAL